MPKIMRLTLCSSAVLIALASLHGCGGGGDSSFANSSKLSLAITDAPVDGAKSVVIRTTGIELKHQNGSSESFDFCNDPITAVEAGTCASPATREIDLLTLTGGDSLTLLDNVTVPHGSYQWIRLKLASTSPATITLLDNTQHDIEIPSGDQTGLKLNKGFTVAQGGIADFTIDFDLRKSIHQTGGGDYQMKPTIRIVDNMEVGSLAGTVATGLITLGCSPAVYIYSGSDVTPDDEFTDSPTAPLASALVKENNQGAYVYKIGFLEPGSYTAAFTCKADLDAPDADDTIDFVDSGNVTVVADETATLDF